MEKKDPKQIDSSKIHQKQDDSKGLSGGKKTPKKGKVSGMQLRLSRAVAREPIEHPIPFGRSQTRKEFRQ